MARSILLQRRHGVSRSTQIAISVVCVVASLLALMLSFGFLMGVAFVEAVIVMGIVAFVLIAIAVLVQTCLADAVYRFFFRPDFITARYRDRAVELTLSSDGLRVASGNLPELAVSWSQGFRFLVHDYGLLIDLGHRYCWIPAEAFDSPELMFRCVKMLKTILPGEHIESPEEERNSTDE